MKKKPADTTLAISADYRQFVEELKSRVATARLTAARRVNHEMISLSGTSGAGSLRSSRRSVGANRSWNSLPQTCEGLSPP